jgi:hypothetical protein
LELLLASSAGAVSDLLVWRSASRLGGCP